MTEELINRFFKKQCTAAESMQVAEYLKVHPELMDKYLSEEEWNNIEMHSAMPEEFWNGMWANIQKKKGERTEIRYLKKMTVAACIAASIGSGFYWYFQTEKAKDAVVLHPQDTPITEPVAERKVITNRSGKWIRIALEDNSLVKLSSGSELHYDTPFQKNKREIWLEGDAYFKVARDETKSFTVYTSVLATTALGTEFRITANGNGNNILVRLYEGKVIIHPAKPSLKGWNKDIYLLPGEQLKYDTNKMLVAVEKITDINNTRLKRPFNPVAKKTEAIATHSLSFNGSSLSEVLKQLARYYSTKIKFNEDEISAMSFTGDITEKDSLPTILNIIAQMNELEVTRQSEGFLVKKINKK